MKKVTLGKMSINTLKSNKMSKVVPVLTIADLKMNLHMSV